MIVYLKLFASLRDKCGYADKELTLQAPARVKEIVDILCEGNPDINRENLLVAVNQEYANADAAVKDGDTVAIFPPVSGG